MDPPAQMLKIVAEQMHAEMLAKISVLGWISLKILSDILVFFCEDFILSVTVP